MTWYFVLMLVITGLLLHWTPNWSRRDILFAVTIRPDFRESEIAQRILSRYRAAVWLSTLGGIVLIAAWTHPLSITLAPLIQIAAAVTAWAWANRRMMPHRTAPSTQVSAPLDVREPMPLLNWILLVGPFLVIAAAALLLYFNYQSIPDRFAVHWGISGAPDRWVVKNGRSVANPLVMGSTVMVLMTIILFLIRNSTPRTAGDSHEVERQQRLRSGTERILLFSNYFMAVLFSYIALRPLIESSEKLNLSIFLPLVLAGVAITIVASVRLAKVSSGAPASVQTVFGDRTDDAYWKLGQFYVNRNDPALLVEKRFGVGYTLNFGHWQAWALLALIALGPLAGFLLR